LLHVKSTKSREILQKFELIAVQGHPRSSIVMPIKSAHAAGNGAQYNTDSDTEFNFTLAAE